MRKKYVAYYKGCTIEVTGKKRLHVPDNKERFKR